MCRRRSLSCSSPPEWQSTLRTCYSSRRLAPKIGQTMGIHDRMTGLNGIAMLARRAALDLGDRGPNRNTPRTSHDRRRSPPPTCLMPH